MYICVTHVDKQSKIPCNEAPMAVGPSFPEVKGLDIVFGNQTQWPTAYPLFFGTCDEDADVTTPGVVKCLTKEEYEDEQWKEKDTKSYQVREQRLFLLRTEVDAINAMRWETLSEENKEKWRTYRQELLDITDQTGFPWNIVWPKKPEEIWSV